MTGCFYCSALPWLSTSLRLVEVAAADLGFKDLAVDRVRLKQVVMRVKCVDLSVVHHDDAVRVLDGRDALGVDDLRRVRDLLAEGALDFRFGRGVAGAGGVVQDQDLRGLKERSRDAEPLALSAGDIRAALLDHGLIAVRHACGVFDELVRAGEVRRMAAFFLRGVILAPAQIVEHRAGEERVLLQDDGDGVAERRQVVIAHVDAADLHAAGVRVVEAADQADQRRFAAARAADDADRLTGVNVQVDVLERVFLGGSLVRSRNAFPI